MKQSHIHCDASPANLYFSVSTGFIEPEPPGDAIFMQSIEGR